MTPEVQLSYLGILLAIIFSFSLGGVIWWMLRVPRAVSPEVAKARVSVSSFKRILVPTLGMPYSEKGIELACRLGHEQKAELVLAYVLEVPRILPLNAGLPEAELKAHEALERAREIVSLHGLEAKIHVERAREAGEGIIRAAMDHGADAIVLGIRPRLSIAQDMLGRTTDILLRRAPCEVIIDKPAG